MKDLILIRHAKSSWADAGQTDFDRPLNDRGKRDAPLMAIRLLEKGIRVQQVFSSAAKRALKTSRLMMETWNLDAQNITVFPELYLAPPEEIGAVISRSSDGYSSLALVAHNPGITEFINTLTENRLDDLPTCGMVGVRIHTDTWADWANAKKEWLFIDYPKRDPSL